MWFENERLFLHRRDTDLNEAGEMSRVMCQKTLHKTGIAEEHCRHWNGFLDRFKDSHVTFSQTFRIPISLRGPKRIHDLCASSQSCAHKSLTSTFDRLPLGCPAVSLDTQRDKHFDLRLIKLPLRRCHTPAWRWFNPSSSTSRCHVRGVTHNQRAFRNCRPSFTVFLIHDFHVSLCSIIVPHLCEVAAIVSVCNYVHFDPVAFPVKKYQTCIRFILPPFPRLDHASVANDVQKITRMFHDVITEERNLSSNCSPHVQISSIVAIDHDIRPLLLPTQRCLEHCATRGFPFKYRTSLFNHCMSISLGCCVRLVQFFPQFLWSPLSTAKTTARMVKLLYCFVSSPDSNSEHAVGFLHKNPLKIIHCVHCLCLLRRQSKFAHDDICISRITLNLKTRTFSDWTMRSTWLWEMTSDSLPPLFMLNRPVIFNS